MFDSSGYQPRDHEPLPHAASSCLRACSCADHTHAEVLRARGSGENGRARKHRAIRLRRRGVVAEANAVAMAEEAR